MSRGVQSAIRGGLLDATNDLILGVFANHDLDWLEAYMVSSQRCGFRGRKILLVWNVATDVRAKLAEYGFELIDVPPATGNFFAYRDKLAYEFLRDHQEFRFVFWMDIRDLVFQTDPSVWMEKNLGDHEIVAGSECIRIKDETINDNWLKDIFDRETYLRIREHEVLNGGTFAGTASAMRDVFKRIHGIAQTTNIIAEQAALNVVLREEFEGRYLVPRMSEAFAIVCYGFGNKTDWTDQPATLRDGVLYPAGSDTPFAIVHQYDRHREWKYPISDRYKVGLVPAPRQRGKGRYAADGLTIDWWG